MIARYVDDSRAFLEPIKAGWRMVDGRLRFRKSWGEEDSDKSGEERTKKIMVASMTGIEEYLEFTAESGSDFPGGCFPTLDTSLKVDDNN